MQADTPATDSKPLNALNEAEGMDGAVFTAQVACSGWTFKAPANLCLLEAAELSGRLDTPLASSCRNGTCRTCICQLRSGRVTYRIAWPGLSLDEKRDGFILPCVAYPLTDVVIELPFSAVVRMRWNQ